MAVAEMQHSERIRADTGIDGSDRRMKRLKLRRRRRTVVAAKRERQKTGDNKCRCQTDGGDTGRVS